MILTFLKRGKLNFGKFWWWKSVSIILNECRFFPICIFSSIISFLLFDFLFRFFKILLTASLDRPKNFNFSRLLILSLKKSDSSDKFPFVSFWIVIFAKLFSLFLHKYPETKSDKSLFIIILDKFNLLKLIFDKNQHFNISLLLEFKKYSKGFFCFIKLIWSKNVNNKFIWPSKAEKILSWISKR